MIWLTIRRRSTTRFACNAGFRQWLERARPEMSTMRSLPPVGRVDAQYVTEKGLLNPMTVLAEFRVARLAGWEGGKLYMLFSRGSRAMTMRDFGIFRPLHLRTFKQLAGVDAVQRLHLAIEFVKQQRWYP